MSNVLVTVGKDVLKVVEAPFKFVDKAVKVVETIIQDDPEAKTIFTELVTLSSVIGTDGAKDIAEKGLNPVDDLATLQAVQALAAYVKSTVVPFVEKAYGEVTADVTSSSTNSPAAA